MRILAATSHRTATKWLRIASAAILTSLGSASAIPIAEYTFSGSNDTARRTSTDTDTYSTASLFSAVGLSPTWTNVAAEVHQDIPNSFDSGKYFTFTITPTAGHEIDFSGLSFKAGLNANGTINHSDDTTLRAALFTVPAGSQIGSQAGQTTFTSLFSSNGTTTYSLGTASFQNITQATEFRLFIWDAGSNSNSTNRVFSLDDVVVNGSVHKTSPVNVPDGGATLTLMGISLTCLACFRRKMAY